MVLFIQTDTSQVEVEECPQSVDGLLGSCSSLKIRSGEFIRKPLQTITPQEGLVYVGEGEMAVGVSDDPNVNYFGSEDATTCHVLVLRHRSTGATALAHIDQVSPDQLDDLVGKLLQVAAKVSNGANGAKSTENFIDLDVVGGYDDERSLSKEISIKLLKWLFRSDFKFCVNIFAVGEINTNFSKSYPSPILYGAGIELKTGHVFPAIFPDHGPDNVLRHVRLSHRERGEGDNDLLHSVYNHETGEFIIPSFKVRTLSPDYEFLTRVPDHVILQNFSTSPKVEPAYFSSEVRDSIKMVLAHPQIEKSIFREKRPKIYKRNKDSIWTLTSN